MIGSAYASISGCIGISFYHSPTSVLLKRLGRSCLRYHFRIVTNGFQSRLRWFITRLLSYFDVGFAISVSLTRRLEVVFQELFEKMSTERWGRFNRTPTGTLVGDASRLEIPSPTTGSLSSISCLLDFPLRVIATEASECQIPCSDVSSINKR
jgi:hypothetical protein